jgi:hypothetical protein
VADDVDSDYKSRLAVVYDQEKFEWVEATAAEITDAGSINSFEARTVHISVSVRAGRHSKLQIN